MIAGRAMRAYVQRVSIVQKEGARQALIAAARHHEARVIRQQSARSGGIAPSLLKIVDGVRGAEYERVRENGRIILQWSYMQEIAREGMDRLKARAPTVSGDYVNGLKFFVGDQLGPAEVPEIRPGAKEFWIVATVPYARRLEIGKNARGGPFVVQVAPHIVQETAELLKHDYGKVAQIQARYVEMDGPLRYQRKTKDRSTKRERRERSEMVRYPAIRVVDRQ